MGNFSAICRKEICQGEKISGGKRRRKKYAKQQVYINKGAIDFVPKINNEVNKIRVFFPCVKCYILREYNTCYI